jgi:hypothetical protein
VLKIAKKKVKTQFAEDKLNMLAMLQKCRISICKPAKEKGQDSGQLVGTNKPWAGFNQCEQNICKHRCNHLLGLFNKPSCDHVVDIIVMDPDSLIRIRIQVYC